MPAGGCRRRPLTRCPALHFTDLTVMTKFPFTRRDTRNHYVVEFGFYLIVTVPPPPSSFRALHLPSLTLTLVIAAFAFSLARGMWASPLDGTDLHAHHPLSASRSRADSDSRSYSAPASSLSLTWAVVPVALCIIATAAWAFASRFRPVAECAKAAAVVARRLSLPTRAPISLAAAAFLGDRDGDSSSGVTVSCGESQATGSGSSSRLLSHTSSLLSLAFSVLPSSMASLSSALSPLSSGGSGNPPAEPKVPEQSICLRRRCSVPKDTELSLARTRSRPSSDRRYSATSVAPISASPAPIAPPFTTLAALAAALRGGGGVIKPPGLGVPSSWAESSLSGRRRGSGPDRVRVATSAAVPISGARWMKPPHWATAGDDAAAEGAPASATDMCSSPRSIGSRRAVHQWRSNVDNTLNLILSVTEK